MVAADNGHLDVVHVAPIFEQFGKVRISHSFVNMFILGAPKAGKTTIGPHIVRTRFNGVSTTSTQNLGIPFQ